MSDCNEDHEPSPPEERVFASWLKTHQPLLDDALEDLIRQVERFLRELRDEHPTLHVEDPSQSARVKELRRILAKCSKRRVHDPEQILHGVVDAFPIGDLIGVRVLVRSLRDIEMIRHALQEHGRTLGDPAQMRLEDHNDAPTKTGYRALHVDGIIAVRMGETDFGVPFEVQFKTLTQHVFGQATHEDAYVRDQVNSHADFDSVRRLQKAMAEALNAADLLHAEIERLSRTLREQIVGQEPGEEITAPGIESVIRDLFDSELTGPEASAAVQRADHAGLKTLTELQDVLKRDGERVQRAEAELTGMLRRRPRPHEILRDVLDRMVGEAAEQQAVEELDAEVGSADGTQDFEAENPAESS
ncbi:MAG TPA: RelA/SpoT domain-containing protein [Solirubrobacteraceae bacterium]|jgi:ppGpp synthetase/RelA/SpoT-type nucleotidyltranferase|nr:RelA/SpoT domain-containing protein [Solirubrobacteraceae bacterium]